MGARLSKDERRAVAQRIFAALCAHCPDRYIALFECPQVGISLPERALTASVASSRPRQGWEAAETEHAPDGVFSYTENA
jgi:hypothetical protein